MKIEHITTIDSTNSELMRRAAAGDYSTVCLVAKEQTAGRGRLGRAWLSDADSLTFSVGLPLAPKDWAGLSLAVGVSIAESLHSSIRIKWPNDLWIDGKKLAGILIETTAMKNGAGDPPSRYVVIGVGINIEAPHVEALPASTAKAMKTPPCGLRDALPSITAGEALERVLAPLLRVIQDFEQLGWHPFAPRFAARDALHGLSINLSSSDAIIASGAYAGLDAAAALQVQTANGLQSFISHEVSVCF